MRPSELSVVGIGRGQPEQLSLAGCALIQHADVICLDASMMREAAALPLAGAIRMIQATEDVSQWDEECHQLVELIRAGARVIRLSSDHPAHGRRLNWELNFLRRHGVRSRFIPSVKTMQDEAWNLGLPWLIDAQPRNLRVIPSAQVRGGRNFWHALADSSETLAVDVGRGRIEGFVKRLLLAGADPDRPVALVAHHPTQSPICWLTTLEEISGLLPQWKPNGATILYIGLWSHAVRDADADGSFWGSLEAAAEDWLRAQRA